LTDARDSSEPAGPRLRLTYVGHATVLIEIDGVRILTDPVLRSRVGPLRRRGPTPVAADLGAIDAVLISHAHPDHFDRASLRAVVGAPVVVVPRGLGAAAAGAGGMPRELDVDEQLELRGVRITAVPARHARWPLQRAASPIGYLIEGSSSVYFAGDTALFPEMRLLAGRTDVALLPVGRWGPPSGPERLTPSTAVDAARLVGAKIAIPIHWGTLYVPGFQAGRWGWGSTGAGTAFADAARDIADLDVVVLQPGEGRDLDA
jgi:L-ascorbate metabolism protein UlaG (beta-lactamase superfamily)